MEEAIDDLRRMATFARVVEAGSFSAAARSLGITTSAVSKQIALLERRLGARLLARSTRRIQVTEAGEIFHRACVQMLEVAREGQLAVGRVHGEPLGTLRVTAPVGLGQHLAPTFGAFARRHPRLGLEVVLDDSVVDLIAERFDVAIRAGRLHESDLIARKLSPLSLVICASPKHLQTRGRPQRPADLRAHDWIGYTPLGVPQAIALARGGRRQVVRLRGRVITNDGAVLRALVLQDLGLALLPRFFVDADLTAGRIETVLGNYELPSTAVWAMYPRAPVVAAKTRLFVDFLAQAAGSVS